jgi:hypothetical protein
MMQDTATKSSVTPALGACDATFGQAATFNSDVGFSLAVSPDKKAFTATFSGLTVNMDGNLVHAHSCLNAGVLALAFWATKTALAGQPLFGGLALEEKATASD